MRSHALMAQDKTVVQREPQCILVVALITTELQDIAPLKFVLCLFRDKPESLMKPRILYVGINAPIMAYIGTPYRCA